MLATCNLALSAELPDQLLEQLNNVLSLKNGKTLRFHAFLRACYSLALAMNGLNKDNKLMQRLLDIIEQNLPDLLWNQSLCRITFNFLMLSFHKNVNNKVAEQTLSSWQSINQNNAISVMAVYILKQQLNGISMTNLHARSELHVHLNRKTIEKRHNCSGCQIACKRQRFNDSNCYNNNDNDAANDDPAQQLLQQALEISQKVLAKQAITSTLITNINTLSQIVDNFNLILQSCKNK